MMITLIRNVNGQKGRCWCASPPPVSAHGTHSSASRGSSCCRV